VSEFGFASAPGRAAWRKALADHDLDELDLRHPIARWHDKTGKGYETFIGYVEQHYPAARTLAEWSYFSQLNQRDAIRLALEHHRAGRFCQGALIWQLNDCWPVQSWALVDSEGEYKAAAYELRRVFAPALACVRVEQQRVSIVVALDNVADARRSQCGVLITRTVDGRTLHQEVSEFDLAPGERRQVRSVDVSKLDPFEALLTVTLDGVASSRLLCEPKEAHLTQPSLSARLDAGAVVVECSAPVIDLFLWADDAECRFVDNFQTLPRAGRLRFRCSGRPRALFARSLAGLHRISLESVS
jgi:beta-mannosidase